MRLPQVGIINMNTGHFLWSRIYIEHAHLYGFLVIKQFPSTLTLKFLESCLHFQFLAKSMKSGINVKRSISLFTCD